MAPVSKPWIIIGNREFVAIVIPYKTATLSFLLKLVQLKTIFTTGLCAIETLPARETWQEIAGLIDELAELAKGEFTPLRFHAELLERVMRASAAAGAVWLCDEEGRPDLEQQSRFDRVLDAGDADLRRRHLALVSRVAANGEPMLISPRAGAVEGGAENPSDYFAILSPITVDNRTIGVVELFQDADKSPAVHRGNQQLLSVVCELAADFHRNRERRQLRDQEQQRRQLDEFVRRILKHLDVDQVAYAIANEGRRIIGCDRVAVLTRRRTSWTVRSVSGVDTIDRRSSAIRTMEKLAASVWKQGAPLWRSRHSPGEDAELEGVVGEHFQETGAALLGVAPLTCEPATTRDDRAGGFVGALVVEHFDDTQAAALMRQRAAWVAEHSAAALHNALRMEELPLMRLSRLIAKSRWLASVRRLPIALLAAAAVAAMIFLPTDFSIESRGELQPVEQEVIYAPADGVVVGLPAFSGAADSRL